MTLTILGSNDARNTVFSLLMSERERGEREREGRGERREREGKKRGRGRKGRRRERRKGEELTVIFYMR